jgi:hypothetical protein
MKRLLFALLPASYVVFVACVGDDPDASGGGGKDPLTDASVDGAGPLPGNDEDGGADAGPLCGYPGEDCCAAPLLPCRAGTSCGTTNSKCMVSSVGIVGDFVAIDPGPSFSSHVTSAFYDGKNWALGPEPISEPGFSGSWSPTDLASGAPGNFVVTLFKSSDGKVFNLAGSSWQKCEFGQACPGPLLPTPALWSVARIANDTWLAGSNVIYRCTAGNGCPKEVTGLESTTWGSGKLVGTSSQDVWLSAGSRAFHFDGTKWTIHDNIKARTIFQVHKDEVWVGDRTFQRWNGTQWSTEYLVSGALAPGIITSISGSSSSDVWAVGYDGSTTGHPAFAAHWDGNGWTLKPLPSDVAESPTIYAPSPIEAFIASGAGVYRFDGTSWTKMTVPAVAAGDGEQPWWSSITGPAKPRP